jgi:hypothetical protein
MTNLVDPRGNPIQSTSGGSTGDPIGVSVMGPDYTKDPALDVDLRDHPDAIQCTAMNHLYVPERFDGEYIVHVVHPSEDPHVPGQAVCKACLDLLLAGKIVVKDAFRAISTKH